MIDMRKSETGSAMQGGHGKPRAKKPDEARAGRGQRGCKAHAHSACFCFMASIVHAKRGQAQKEKGKRKIRDK